MAFRQPTFAPPARQISQTQPEYHTSTPVPSPQQRALEDSQEWVLFPQAQARSSTQTQTTYTEGTPRTAGLSRLSDFGSLNTAAKSGQGEEDNVSTNEGAIEDDEELDSLDDGLQAFQEPSPYWSSRQLDASNSILPTHDGLGTFPASSPPVQEQLWRFEQYNPRKRPAEHQQRRSSVQRRLDAATNADNLGIDSERLERIEKWRMEQSRVLLDEIEKETRRNRRSHGNGRAGSVTDVIGEDGVLKDSGNLAPTNNKHELNENPAESLNKQDNDSFWQRVTRRVIRDLMGIDDVVLSVIFGESLPEDRPSKRPSGAPAPNSVAPELSTSTSRGVGWKGRLLDRLTRELGILVQQLSDHPGAFTTALNPSKLDYAGIPITSPILPKPTTTTPQDDFTPLNSSSSLQFTPTLQNHDPHHRPASSDSTHAALWGIEEESPSAIQDREYWERTPDLKTIFRFLHSRCSSCLASPASKPANIATSSTPDSLRRAAIIRQHHPLVSRSLAQGRRGDTSYYIHHQHHNYFRSSSSAAMSSAAAAAQRRRAESSCGSVSVRRARSGGSKNYWDLRGGSVGSGSLMASMGGWGEV